MEMIKAVKIDVVNKTVSIISVEKDNSQHLRDHVGGWITLAMTLPSGDIMYVDDEGLLKNPENFQYWDFPNRGRKLFAGNGVIVGDVGNGESCDVKMTIEDIKDLHFIDDRATAAILAVGCDQ